MHRTGTGIDDLIDGGINSVQLAIASRIRLVPRSGMSS